MKPTNALCAALLAASPLLSHLAHAAEAPRQFSDLFQGRFDNREQLAQAKPDAEHPLPHVVVDIEPTSQKGWTLWHVHLQADAESAFDQVWAMHAQREYDGSLALVPYYQYKPAAAPSADTFDPSSSWLSLEACALRGQFAGGDFSGMSEGEPCVAVSMGIGPIRALLPVGIERKGDRLQLDLNYRSVRTRIDARQIR